MAEVKSKPVFGHEGDVSVEVDLKSILLAVDCLQDVVELGDERPERTRSDDKKEDAVHLLNTKQTHRHTRV
jgi:hypothetical protein